MDRQLSAVFARQTGLLLLAYVTNLIEIFFSLCNVTVVRCGTALSTGWRFLRFTFDFQRTPIHFLRQRVGGDGNGKRLLMRVTDRTDAFTGLGTVFAMHVNFEICKLSEGKEIRCDDKPKQS